MPTIPNASPVTDDTHGELTCADVEALLADANTEINSLRAENVNLNRRLEIAIGRKNLAIDEAVDARSRA